MQDDDAGILFGPLEAVNRRAAATAAAAAAAAAAPLSATVCHALPAHTAAVSAWFPNRRRSEDLERRAKDFCPKANLSFVLKIRNLQLQLLTAMS